MKSWCFGAAAVAATLLLGSGVLGAPSLTAIQPVNSGGNSYAYAISEDGQYVAGRTYDTDAAYSAAVWDTTTGVWTVVPATGGSTPGSGNAVGVGHRSGGPLFVGANMADNGVRTYATANQFGKLWKGGDTFATLLSPVTDVMVGAADLRGYPSPAGNSVAAFADGTDAWVTGWHSQGTNSKGNEGYIWKASSTTPYATATGRGSSKLELLQVSSIGRAVGDDSNGGVRRAVYVDAGAGGTVAVNEVGHVPNYDGANAAIAYGISDDGNYIVGTQRITTVTRAQAFIWKVGDPQAMILNTAGGSPNANEQAFAQSVTDDGFVVGYAYSTTWSPTSQAVAWLPWDDTHTCVPLMTLANNYGIDTTGWTAFGSGASSVTKVGDDYYITGTGTYNGTTRGYLLVIPEPATLSLLGLAGLALLRRR